MRWKSVVMMAALACTLAGQPRHAAAQVADGDTGVERVDKEKFWDYMACGASIVLAAGTGGWFIAGIACGRALTMHWTN